MQDSSSPRTLTVTDPQASRLLLDPIEFHFFEPFLSREITVGEAAALLGCKPNSLLARVRRMLACGLLEIVREVPRAGRAIKVYRSVADVFFVQKSSSPIAEYGVWVRSRSRLLQTGVQFAQSQATRVNGDRIYRDEHGVVNHTAAVSLTENHDPLRPDEPAVYTASHDAVHLDFEEAKQFQRDLHALMGRYKTIGGGQRYLVWLNLVPLPAEASPVDRER